MNKRLIFITNDDGYRSGGIAALIEMAKPYGDIVVVAPAHPQSAMSSALTSRTPLRLHKIEQQEGLQIYACDGTPADCVKLAMSHVFTSRRPDLLLSGINHGTNASIAVIYSGTLGAAMEGTLYKIPSIGFSLDNYSADADFSSCIPYGRKIIDKALAQPFSADTFLNVNFPNLDGHKIAGIRLCRQHKGAWVGEFEKRTDPQGGDYYWMAGRFESYEKETENTDENELKKGYVSVVPHQVDMTNYKELDRLHKEWVF